MSTTGTPGASGSAGSDDAFGTDYRDTYLEIRRLLKGVQIAILRRGRWNELVWVLGVIVEGIERRYDIAPKHSLEGTRTRPTGAPLAAPPGGGGNPLGATRPGDRSLVVSKE